MLVNYQSRFRRHAPNGRPFVLRYDTIPDGILPKWFKTLDTNMDGQISLGEWRAAGGSLEVFKTIDSNDDGFVTPEEMLTYVNAHLGENLELLPQKGTVVVANNIKQLPNNTTPATDAKTSQQREQDELRKEVLHIFEANAEIEKRQKAAKVPA